MNKPHEEQRDAAIGTAWDQAKARMAHDPYTPHEAFFAGALWAQNASAVAKPQLLKLLESVRVNAEGALHHFDQRVHARTSMEMVAEDVLRLQAAMLSQTFMDRWIPLEERMPEERVRVYAAFGTIVWEDVFYGVASSTRTAADGAQKRWRYTHNEQPLEQVPTEWMPHPPVPAAPARAKHAPAEKTLATQEAS